MPEYLSPGVYVEEIDTGSKPIEGVSTSTAGFVGVTRRGPIAGPPILITSFSAFQRTFGRYLDASWGDSRFLAYAVQGFFQNEGQRVFIKRAPGTGALQSGLDVGDGIVTRLRDDMAPPPTQARLESLLGISVGTPVTFTETVGGVVFAENRAVVAYDSVTGTITWAGPLAHAYTRARTAVTIRAIAGPTLRVDARDPGVWGDDVRVLFESTTPARSELRSALSTPLVATVVRPLGLNPGPAAAAGVATLVAGETPLINVDDLVEFDDGAGGVEILRVTATNPGANQITVTPPAGNDYSVAAARARALLAPPGFNLALGPSPAVNPQQADLGAGEGRFVQVGDTVEFGIGGLTEQRVIIGVAGDTISWVGNVQNDYTIGGATVRMLTAARAGDSWLRVPAVAGLLPGDQLTVTANGVSEAVVIDAGWNGATASIPLQNPLANTFLEGAIITQPNLAARVGTNSIRVQSSRSFYVGALVELDNGNNREYFTVLAINGNDLILDAPTVNNFQIGNYARLVEFKLSARYLNEAERIDELETFPGLSLNPGLPTKYAITVVNGRSNLIRLIDLAGPAVAFDNATTVDGGWQQLTGGDDGNPPPDADFIGVDFGPGNRTGLQALVDIDQISIVAIPGKTSQVVINAMIGHCESLSDRFAVVDPPIGQDIQDIQDVRALYDTKFAAIYYPWLEVRDPLVQDNIFVPPSGHIVGIYARSDVERGVHKAPANEIVGSILDFEFHINKREHDILNPLGINVLRDFRSANRGLRVWGARTMSSDSDARYVNVRRLILFIAESIDEGTQWAVFEPNDPVLWARLRQAVSAFLTRVWRDGALFGATAEQAFFVRCDETTMTPDDLENGRLIMIVGIAPVRPAEFVIIRIGLKPSGAEIEEL